ncbi:MAG: phosphoribosylformylglycinamidine synthase I [Candidatus Curtissbacteria bacterium]
MAKPRVCVLRTDGTNCDEELFYAFDKYQAAPQYVHINQLRDKTKRLKDFEILALPGGFSYGDDVASGKILAVELMSYLKNEIEDFVTRKGIVVGVCNGFQTLIRTGLLPFTRYGQMDATLTQNESGHFECRWVKIKVEKSKCVFLPETRGTFDIAVNHGEGRIYAPATVIKKIEDEHLVVFRYVDHEGKATQKYPMNPNGSTHAIAGLTNPTGRILGLMPHPEKFVDKTQFPNWRRRESGNSPGFIIKNMVKFAKDS